MVSVCSERLGPRNARILSVRLDRFLKTLFPPRTTLVLQV
jgi:hypothetical protein